MHSNMNDRLRTGLKAEYPVKGSELLPPDSSLNELEVRNAILLWELLIDEQMQCNAWLNMEYESLQCNKRWNIISKDELQMNWELTELVLN